MFPASTNWGAGVPKFKDETYLEVCLYPYVQGWLMVRVLPASGGLYVPAVAVSPQNPELQPTRTVSPCRARELHQREEELQSSLLSVLAVGVRTHRRERACLSMSQAVLSSPQL